MSILDLDEVVAIETRAYEFPWSRGIFSDCLRVGYHAWCYEKDAELVGYGVMSVAVAEAHILNLTVRPESQRQGIGETLLRHFMHNARRHEADVLMLEVRPSNLPAVALYRKLGFDEVGVRHGYYPAAQGREDALILACGL
jgi:ribosomal-protein-alanine N-acetyltransferase